MGSGASKLKYKIENSSADHVVAALKEQLSQEQLSQEAVAEFEACSSRLIQRIQDNAQGDQDGALPMSLSDAKTTEELVTWCRQIENLQEKHRETLVSWVEEQDHDGESLLLLTEEEWKEESGLKGGPLKKVLARVKAETNPPSQNMTSAAKSPDAPHAGAVPHACADHEGTSPTSHQASPVESVEYSLEDPADLAKFMKTADICFVRAEYFWQLFDQNKVPPARRQELEEDDENVIKKDDGTYASPLVSHEEVEKWASGKEEALLCSISHCWESMEHADPLGDQTRRVASATALYAAAYGAQVWVFMDFLSIYQYEQTPDQRKSFELAMQNMHLMYSHESTMTLRLEHLTPPAKIKEAKKDKENTVKIWHKPANEVKDVPISALTWNNREYIRRGWCRTEVQWSSARSTVLSNQQIDSHLNSDETKFNGQVAEAPEQFRLRTRSEKIQFMRDSDRSIVLDLQKKVFLQKAEKCEHLVVENVDATQIAILADSIEHYKVLKGLTLKNFRCELQEAESLWKVLAKMEKLQRVWYMKPGDDDSLRVMKEARESCKSQVSFKEGKNNVEKTPEWRKKRRQPEPKVPGLLELLQGGGNLEKLDLKKWKSDQRKAVLRALKRSVMVKHVELEATRGEELPTMRILEELKMLLPSATSVQCFEIVGEGDELQKFRDDIWHYIPLLPNVIDDARKVFAELKTGNEARWNFDFRSGSRLTITRK